MVKHIFCDLDGTLLKEFKRIDDEDIRALKRAEEKGIQVSIATGRLDYEIKKVMDTYNLSGYRVSQNGAVVFDKDNKLIYEEKISTEDVLLILNKIKDENVIVFFQTENDYYVQEKNEIILQFEKSQDLITYHENTNILNELDKYHFITISLWCEKDYNKVLSQKLNKMLPNHLVSIVSSGYTIDITHSKNSKGNAIKHICQMKQIDLNDVAVIGDSYNDISMFELTKHSFVMNESHEEVKHYAKKEIYSVKDAVYQLIK